ncbi:MAG: hypothetical protein QN163_08640 [Armatimonadota bacterium]|nr:hypothetical protein [Armatimonadota bacterium]MDR5696565.1 hypothetical protein [Armatimonadota bacterium]
MDERDVLTTVHIPLTEAAVQEVRSVLEAEGWNEEEGLRILLGYGAAVRLTPPPDDPLRALGAARAELATLRHRAYLADEAVRGLRMNLVGLEASVAQARRSLAYWEHRRVEPNPQAADGHLFPAPTPGGAGSSRIQGWIGRLLEGLRRAR